MLRFNEFISEGNAPAWVQVAVGSIALKISSLQSKIENESDSVRRDILLGQQNKLLAVISSLSVVAKSKDKKLMSRLKSMSKKRS